MSRPVIPRRQPRALPLSAYVSPHLFSMIVASAAIGASSSVCAQETSSDRPKADQSQPASALPAVTVSAHGADDSYTTAGAVTVGSKIPATLKETPQSVSVITRKRMEDQNLNSLDEVMAQTPGVTVQPYNTGVIPQFYSRGYPIEYFQYDGVPLQTGGASWTMPEMVMFERVELLRGAAGLYNGAGYPGGVINLVRKRPGKDLAFSGSVAAGSWNARRTELDFSSPLNESGSLRTRLAVNYDARDSFIDYAKSEKSSAYGIIEADLAPGTTLAAGFGYQKRNWTPAMMGLPRYSDGGELGLPRSTFFNTPWTNWNFESTQLFAELSHRIDQDWSFKLNLTSDHETSNLKYSYVFGAVNRQTLAGARLMGGANQYDNQQYGVDGMLSGRFQAFGRQHDVVVGANWYQRSAESWGGSLPGYGGTAVNVFNYNPAAIADPGTPKWTSKSNTDLTQYGLYGSARLKLADPLSLILGARVSWWKTKSQNLLTSATTSDFNDSAHWTPYAGLVYDLTPNWSLYTSYADIYRVQSNYKDSSGNGLPPVTGANYEAGIKGEFYDGALNTSFAVFRIDETNRAIQTSVTVVDGCCYATNGQVRSQGFEAELAGRLLPGLEVGAGYTFNTTKYLRDATFEGQPFRTMSPKHMLRLWSSYQLPGELNAWSVGAGVNAQSETSVQSGAVRASQGVYAVANARIGYRIDKRWSLGLNINNLFDRTYYILPGASNAPASYGSVYGDPRNIMLTLRGTL